MSQMVSLTVDGRRVSVPAGTMLREACRAAGETPPALCWHEHLTPANACRACVVQVHDSRALVAACSRPVAEDMVVETNTPRVLNARKIIAELLASAIDPQRAPDLLELVQATGADVGRFGGATPRVEPVKDDNPFFVRDYSQCILCYRCVEACGVDAQNTFAISAAGRGVSARIDAAYDRTLPESDCVFCGNCVAVCPTGALIDRQEWQLRSQAVWDPARITTTETVCSFCGVGCTLSLQVMDNRIVKVTSPHDNPVTHGMLCVKGRYGYAYVQAGDP
ncbi:MAG: 2Fe-2S iron-sulfur cluster-binding protein [Thermaerobacter sp.]|nr:2Fe-2S iron-sulfur cluster-binding protein [Thermaerobacter sp.]